MLDKDSSTNMDDGTTTSAHIVNLEKPNVYQSVAEEIFFIDNYECVRKIHNGTVSAVKMISEFYYSRSTRIWLRSGVLFVLASCFQNRTKNIRGPSCVCIPHMQSKDPHLPVPRYGHREPLKYYIAKPLKYYIAKHCIPDWITLR